MSETVKPSRRAALTGLAGALAAVPAVAASAPADEPVLALWAARHALRQPIIDAGRAHDDAWDRLPWWARDGLQYLHHDGSFSGPNVGWPAIQGIKAPARSYVLVRPGKADLRRKYDADQLIDPELALVKYRKSSRQLAARLRAKDAEYEKAGVAAAEARIVAVGGERHEIEERIAELEPASPNVVAARVLLEANEIISPDESIHDMPESGSVLVMVLSFLRPSLTGLVRAHVDEIFDHPRMPAQLLQAMLGDWPAPATSGAEPEARGGAPAKSPARVDRLFDPAALERGLEILRRESGGQDV